MTAADSERALAPLLALRAEDLSPDEIRTWTGAIPDDERILRRLTGPGPKLLKGPRGSGKSNYLRRAFFDLKARGDVLVTYVNFSQHLALEPLMLRTERALEFFRQWLVYKVIISVEESLGDDHDIERLEELATAGRAFVNALQTHTGQSPSDLPERISPSELLTLLEKWSAQAGARRCVILMDDAAHAFMHQQQREFFELFRALRSRQVACKAAIYPGVTSYSPFFNVGHEAEELEAWIRPDSTDYLDSMRSIFNARFPEEMRELVRPELVDLAAYAAFGLPRNFLNILSDSVSFDEEDEIDADGDLVLSPPSLARVRKAIRLNADRVRSLFAEISDKLPRYVNFIAVGQEVEDSMIGMIKRANRRRDVRARNVGVALSLPFEGDLDRVFSLLEYAGVVRRLGPVSRGGRGQFEKIQIHTSLIIAENALVLGRNPSAESFGAALERRSADDFVRRKSSGFFGPDRAERCQLNLTPCLVCQTPRVSDDAAFCFKCGNPLTEQSVYEELLRADLDVLHLTPVKRERIAEHTSLATVQDVLLDDGSQLLSVPSIGQVWSARIKARAEEFVTL